MLIDCKDAETLLGFARDEILRCYFVEDVFTFASQPLELPFPITDSEMRKYYSRVKQQNTDWQQLVKASCDEIQKLQKNGWPEASEEALQQFKNLDRFPQLAGLKEILVRFNKTISAEELLDSPHQEIWARYMQQKQMLSTKTSLNWRGLPLRSKRLSKEWEGPC